MTETTNNAGHITVLEVLMSVITICDFDAVVCKLHKLYVLPLLDQKRSLPNR